MAQDEEMALFLLKVQIESTADWHREKALQLYPEDSRNLRAARLLDKLAADFANVPDREAEAYAQVYQSEEGDISLFREMGDAESEALWAVGFSSEPESATDFLRTLTKKLGELVRERVS